MGKYFYEGPVVEFGTCVMNHWKAETIAVSEAKARSNLAYQFKTAHKRLASATNITLPGKLVCK